MYLNMLSGWDTCLNLIMPYLKMWWMICLLISHFTPPYSVATIKIPGISDLRTHRRALLLGTERCQTESSESQVFPRKACFFSLIKLSQKTCWSSRKIVVDRRWFRWVKWAQGQRQSVWLSVGPIRDDTQQPRMVTVLHLDLVCSIQPYSTY